MQAQDSNHLYKLEQNEFRKFYGPLRTVLRESWAEMPGLFGSLKIIMRPILHKRIERIKDKLFFLNKLTNGNQDTVWVHLTGNNEQ